MTTTEGDVRHDVHPRRQEMRSLRSAPVLLLDGFPTPYAGMGPGR